MDKKINLWHILIVFILFQGLVVQSVFAENNIELVEKAFNRAILLMDSAPSIALQELTTAAELNPNNPKIFVAIGQVHFKLNDHQEAIKAFEKAIKINKDFAVAYSNLGYAYMSLKNWDKAIQNFRIILKYPNLTAPHYVHNAIGWAFYEKNEFIQSIDELKKAIQMKGNYSTAYYNLGLSLIGLEKIDEAITKLKEAIKYQPGFVQAHNQLALLYLKRNLNREAREEFKKVIEFVPDSPLAKDAENYMDLIN